VKQDGSSQQSWRFIVEPAEAGQRLDQILSARTSLGRRKVREILKLGGVQVNRRRVRVAGRVPPVGAEIRVTVDESLGPEPNFKPEIIFEDDWILALNKPPGIPAQGTQASDRHDFFAVAQNYFADQKLFLVHRLDAGTSGVLLFAKTSEMAAKIGKLFQGRSVKKTYLAAIQGRLEPCTLELPIGRVPNARPACFGCSGNLIDIKPAITKVYPFEPTEGDLPTANWVIAEPLTGRTHQIRVHLAHLGNPVVGDALYGGLPSNRLWLHAWKLELFHPGIKEMIKIQADMGSRIENQPGSV
jgi:RluA family pseudouridine synthase